MSDSELSDDPGTPMPSDNELERSLRREVVKASKTGDDITVKRIRAASEKRLGLSENFYKGHAMWKDKSKDIIEDQVNNEEDVPSSPVLKKSKPAKSGKRKSAEAEDPPKKKRKVSDDEDSALSFPPSEDESEPEKRPKEATKKAKVSLKSKKEPGRTKPAKPSKEEEASEGENGNDSKVADGHISDSDLSVLIDDEPSKRKKPKSKDPQEKPKRTRTKSNAKAVEDPDQAEIKRLQGWLVKCGIRKVWGKELKPYETPKAKIKHLKDMLSDAGMTGRYSVEKASQIQEARELAADIEAVKEGDERWGMGEEEEPDDGGRPQRRLVRGAKHFDFLSSDGEETD